MSHNITLQGVKIRDLSLLASAVKDLSEGKASLDRSASSFRTFRGQPTDCDAAIQMPGPHDVGLKRNKDGSYTPVFDPYSMAETFGTYPNKLGRLLQEYSLREAEYEAAQRGYSSTRIEGSKGTITLELTQP